MVTLHSTNPKTSDSKNDKHEILLLLHFWRHLTHCYNTEHEVYINNTYLIFMNGFKITKAHIYYFSIVNGEGYQVTEKWVFFKL
jgi:hypothetical protein